VAKRLRNSLIPRHVGSPAHRRAIKGPVVVKVELQKDTRNVKNPQHKLIIYEVDATKQAKRNPGLNTPIVTPSKREVVFSNEEAHKVREPVKVQADSRHNNILCSLCRTKFKHIKTFSHHSCISPEN